MKYLFSVVLLLSVAHASYSQPMNNMEAECFILGTLSDYMGRNLDPREKNLLDRYDALNGPVVDALETMIKRNYPGVAYKAERYKDKDGEPLSYKIYSDTLTKRFNNYYLFTPQQHWTDTGEEIPLGRINAGMIITEEQKQAFIAGVYARFGVRCDTAYHISIANSVSKAKLCNELLAELGCKSDYQIMRNVIPNGHHVFFHPSAKVMAYLNKYSSDVNNRIAEVTKQFIERMMSKYGSKTDSIIKEASVIKN